MELPQQVACIRHGHCCIVSPVATVGHATSSTAERVTRELEGDTETGFPF